ncbi:Methionyl-tRNA formyltransferase [hydrothermal vent metagenome]|uniref:methionyl-tRNA formyltransferase n=1 Tax=hydrothermal vent metagenome TaxID=652676 RepID=A0A3B0V925_9ZZZZ
MSSKPLRIIFMGTPDFAVPALQALINGPDLVVAVICQPDRARGRGRKTGAPPVKILAEKHHLAVLQPASIRTDDFFEQVKELAPDLVVVAAYGKILPGRLLRLPPLGTINVHGSLLPKYRGAAPIQWALINGEQETGITIMQVDEGMDTGDILLQVSRPIKDDDTAGSLFAALAELGGETLVSAVSQLKKGQLQAVRQDDRLATGAPMLTKEQGHLDWRRAARDLHCLIRGLDPWPSAYSFLAGKRFRFFKPLVVDGPVAEPPGTICRADKNGLLIATGHDYLLVREIQPEGKKRMSVQACLCGLSLPTGEQLH